MKPGATTWPRASISRVALASAQIANARDAIALDCDVGVEAGPAGAIDDAAVADDDVVFRERGHLRSAIRNRGDQNSRTLGPFIKLTTISSPDMID